MTRISTIGALLLALVLLAFSSISSAAADWPIKRKIDLSSGFGDYRDDRFHAGLDLRTGGKIGEKVFAPVDGYLYRVKMSYKGYGKGLYLMGDDGHIYVFGHLSQFSDRLRPLVQKEQLKVRRYFVDLFFPADSVRIERGEMIAYSGKTGTGAPHLHFEKRTPDNRPINPLRHEFEVADATGPTFSRIGFKMIDDRSLFENGRRDLFVSAVAAPGGGFRLDQVLYLNRPFGILADCFDQMRPGGMRQSVYRLSLYIDDQLEYEVVFDTLDFETQTSVNLEYDYLRAVDEEKHVRRLFERVGNAYSGSRPVRRGGGTFGDKGDETAGLHTAKIIAEDCFGNRSELRFDFLWGTDQSLYTLDSTVTGSAGVASFYFSPTATCKALEIDSVRLYINLGDQWAWANDATVAVSDDGSVRVDVPTRVMPGMVMRPHVYTGGGAVIKDEIFSRLMPAGKGNAVLSHEVIDDGLLVTIAVPAKSGAVATVALYDGGHLLGTEPLRLFTMKKYIGFIPVDKKYSRITRIGYSMTADTSRTIGYIDSLNIHIVGLRDNQLIEIENYGSVWFDRDHFFEPRYIEFKRNPIVFKGRMRLNSDHFEVLPEAFVCRREFDLSINLPGYNPHNERSGICWLDKKNDRWVWLDNVNKDGVLRTKSIGGGSFAVLYDYAPPEISQLNIIDGKTYYGLRPLISFSVADSLSGIVDDLNFTIKLDGQWMIPEYDPEDKVCRTQPVEPIENGKHHLGIIVTDRLGNTTEQYLNFYVAESRRRRR